MVYKEISCSFCKQKFLRRTGQINEACKFGWKQYCSWNCLSKDKLRGTEKTCENCNKKIYRPPRELKKSISRKTFCSLSCRAVYYNRIKRLNLPIKICKAEGCQNKIVSWQIFCSRKCSAKSRKKTIEDLRKEVISKIRNFYRENHRIPVKKEMYGAYGKARDSFGTWNKAVKAAGFKPNPVMFAKKHIALDGHKCDSLAEKIIDDWLYSKKISHTRNIPYPDKKFSCDFGINGFFVEFFGLDGQHKKYTELAKKKRRMAKKYDLKLVELKPIHLFPENKLDTVLNFK